MSDKTIRIKKASISGDLNAFLNEHPILASLGTMGLLGAGTAGVASMIRDFNDSVEERRKAMERKNPKPNKNTIVLRIPRSKLPPPDMIEEKAAEIEDTQTKVKSEESDSQHLISIDMSDGATKRDKEGKFVPKFLGKKASTPPKTGAITRYYEIMSGLGGAFGGYMLMDHIFRKAQQNRLKKERDIAKKQYLDMLDGSEVKGAEAVNDLFQLKKKPIEKKAFPNPITAATELAKDVGAGTFSAWTLGALASAYLTKKVMDKHFKDMHPEEPPRRVNRVLFSLPEEYQEDEEKRDEPVVKPAEFNGTPQMKFVMKVAEDRKVEVRPDVALALIQMMKEAMEAEAFEKRAMPFQQAAEKLIKNTVRPDFNAFTEWAASQPGGIQWALDHWAKSSGLSRPSIERLPNGATMPEGLAGTSAGLAFEGNPSKYFPNMKNGFMENFRNNPERWLTVMGDKKNADFMNFLSMKGLKDAFGKGGQFERFGKVPILGDLMQTITGYFIRNTGWGKKFGLNSYLMNNLGMTKDQANGITGKFNYNADGTGWSMAPNAAAAPSTPATAPAT